MSGSSCKSCVHADKCKILQTYIEGVGSFLKITKEWGFEIEGLDKFDELAQHCPEYISPRDLMKSMEAPTGADTTGV